MDPDFGAGLLHRLTRYVPDREWDVPVDDPRVRQDLPSMEPSLRPPLLKAYQAELPRIMLPRDFAGPDVDATEVLVGRPGPAVPLDAESLGRILFLGAGVVRTAERNGNVMLFRAAGSAGARFPLEVYVAALGVAGVPDGVHWYDGAAHALVQVGPPPADGSTTLVVTGVPWRSGWRYGERAFRHVYWDAGTLLSQLEAAASSAGREPRLWTDFPDRAVAGLVGADGTHEFPVALLTIGGGEPATTGSGAVAGGELPAVEHPLTTAAQRAGDRETLGRPWPVGDQVTGVDSHEELDDLVLRRGSQRLMDRARTLPLSALEWPMAVALRGIDVPHWVVVHGVDDVEPGVYRWPDLGHPIRTGDLREEVARVCLDQALGGDAAFVVVGATSTGDLDDRGYRSAQLAAGLVEGRLHLAAYAVGASATGMTFLDSEVPALLGAEDEDDLVTLLFTCVGVPEYRARRGGRPGAPVALDGSKWPR